MYNVYDIIYTTYISRTHIIYNWYLTSTGISYQYIIYYHKLAISYYNVYYAFNSVHQHKSPHIHINMMYYLLGI